MGFSEAELSDKFFIIIISARRQWNKQQKKWHFFYARFLFFFPVSQASFINRSINIPAVNWSWTIKDRAENSAGNEGVGSSETMLLNLSSTCKML